MRRSSALLALALVAGASTAPPAARATDPARALVTVAVIDTGINPYAPAFRDDSGLAQLPPSHYLPGYPPDCAGIPAEPTTDCAVRLELQGFKAATLKGALAIDRDIWGDPAAPEEHPGIMQRGQLYYIPGTKIVGAVSFGSGGQYCARKVAGQRLPILPPVVPLGLNASSDCPERVVLDDFGHGTMTASRSTGAPNSLAPSARIVAIEGLGAASSRWAAEQRWIDLQSNSWGAFVPAPADTTHMETFEEIAQKHLVLVASGNGLAFSGYAPTPTQLNGLGAAGVVLVGGHDNGRVTAWSGQPAHVVADAYAGYSASNLDNGPMRPMPMSCCTSAAAPYAAGGAAAVLLHARELLGDDGTTPRAPGVFAVAGSGASVPASGPLADGSLTLDEWRALVFATAEARPREGKDDGERNFIGGPSLPRYPEYGPGENPFCMGCWTLPIPWTQVPDQYPAYVNVGYGAINERSVATASDVLAGYLATPARAAEDAFFAQMDQVRDTLWGR